MFSRRLLLLCASTVLILCPPAAAAQDCTPNALKGELLKRGDADQLARKALVADPKSKEALDETLRVDADNTKFMRAVVSKCGWPRRSAVGEPAAKAAWLLTQHADMDPEYQVLAARELKYAVLAKEAEPWDLAALVDRNRRLNDQPQVYGMQYFVTPEKTVRFYDIVTPAKLDERRKEIGLPSFYCWALVISSEREDAPIEWPRDVLFAPQDCDKKP